MTIESEPRSRARRATRNKTRKERETRKIPLLFRSGTHPSAPRSIIEVETGYCDTSSCAFARFFCPARPPSASGPRARIRVCASRSVLQLGSPRGRVYFRFWSSGASTGDYGAWAFDGFRGSVSELATSTRARAYPGECAAVRSVPAQREVYPAPEKTPQVYTKPTHSRLHHRNAICTQNAQKELAPRSARASMDW